MADTILMIHGSWVGPWYWANYRRVFEAEGFRCIAAALPRHGPARRSRASVARGRRVCRWLAQATADGILNPLLTVLPPNKHVNRTACKLRLRVEVRTAILMMLLAVVSNSAAADWLRLGSNGEGISYADPATIRKAGDRVKMWDLADFKAIRTVSGKSYLSTRTQYEYDCAEAKSRLLEVSAHSENMAHGETVYSNANPRDWRPNPPGSGIEVLWKFACGK